MRQQMRLHKSTKRICHNIFSQYFPSNCRFLGSIFLIHTGLPMCASLRVFVPSCDFSPIQ
jgi:hypothetical protein